MKVFIVAFFVAIATASPLPLEQSGDPVELIVNGVPEGEPLEISDIVNIKLKEHSNGVLVSSTDLLHPLTAEGIAEAEAAAQENEPENPAVPSEPIVVPEPVELPESVLPVVLPEPAELPAPVLPVVVPEPAEIPQPVFPELPAPVELPESVLPVVVPEELEINLPAPQLPIGEIYNDGTVQVTVNAPETASVFTTLQNWVQMFLNYFNGEVQTTEQII